MKGQRLGGAVAIVTGASSGIGLETAKVLAARGANVVLAARNEAALRELATELDRSGKGTVLVAPTDVTDPAAVDELVRRTLECWSRIDVLIANAGITQRSEFLDTDAAVFRRLMEVNFFGVLHVVRATLPAMVRQGSGRIVVVSSIAGRVATPLRSGYAASKFALHGLANALRIEVARKGVGVTVVCPSFTRTPISRRALLGDGREQGHDDKLIASGQDPRAVAEAIARAVERGHREVHLTAGGKLVVRLDQLAPRLVDWILGRVAVR